MDIQILSLIIHIVSVDHLDHTRFLIWLETKKKIVGLRLKVLCLIFTLGIILILPQFSIEATIKHIPLERHLPMALTILTLQLKCKLKCIKTKNDNNNMRH